MKVVAVMPANFCKLSGFHSHFGWKIFNQELCILLNVFFFNFFVLLRLCILLNVSWRTYEEGGKKNADKFCCEFE